MLGVKFLSNFFLGEFWRLGVGLISFLASFGHSMLDFYGTFAPAGTAAEIGVGARTLGS